MTPKKKSTPSASRNTSSDTNIVVHGDVRESVILAGANNTVNQTIIQKFFNIFKSDSETLEQRNRRILLGHVESFWVRGVLDKSLHGAALVELEIKESPEAVKTYPWAIQKEATQEILPAGTSMLDAFDQIGMGRSLLILGAPGSGKTTMLLELARQLIERARQDVTEPVPMVFNLASWNEKLSLADWLEQELNSIYSVPRKTAPDWVEGNKLLLLLDGLDEVRQESRSRCVDAINTFRKEHGLTSLVVCSRSQDYTTLKNTLSFEGAIEVQPLTQEQITAFFNRFGKAMAGIKRMLQKDGALREMAETPLFLSIMIMAYKDRQDIQIPDSADMNAQRSHLFKNYIARMFEHPRSKHLQFQQQDVLNWLSWLSQKMIEHSAVPFLFENLQPDWLGTEERVKRYRRECGQIYGILFGLALGLPSLLAVDSIASLTNLIVVLWAFSLSVRLLVGTLLEPTSNMFFLPAGIGIKSVDEITMIDSLSFNWANAKKNLIAFVLGGVFFGFFFMVAIAFRDSANTGLLLSDRLTSGLYEGLRGGWMFGSYIFIGKLLISGVGVRQIDRTTYPGQRIYQTRNSFLLIFMLVYIASVLVITLRMDLSNGLIAGLTWGLFAGFFYGGATMIQHYLLRSYLMEYKLFPWQFGDFLVYCEDLIFLRRVGGGYIFVHRLLMEHFAEMKFDGIKGDIRKDGISDKLIDYAQKNFR